ncbi:MAG: hypothetical protein ABJF23_24170 [Bryobacteraceae bacterium]
MNFLRSCSTTTLFAVLGVLSLPASATAGQYLYGVAADSTIHRIDLTSYLDTIVFDTGLSGITNGVAWDSASGKLYYRTPEDYTAPVAPLYTWEQATGIQSVLGGQPLPGFTSNAAMYNGAYWYVESNSHTLVKATIVAFDATHYGVANVTTFDNFDGSNLTSFSFGDIAISKSGILYGSSNNGLFSLNIAGATPNQFQVINPNFGVRQISLDPTGTFLYGHDYASGKWYISDLNGIETPMYKSPGVQFITAGLRDIGEVISTLPTIEAVPEPSAWQLLLAGAGCLAIPRLRRKLA